MNLSPSTNTAYTHQVSVLMILSDLQSGIKECSDFKTRDHSFVEDILDTSPQLISPQDSLSVILHNISTRQLAKKSRKKAADSILRVKV